MEQSEDTVLLQCGRQESAGTLQLKSEYLQSQDLLLLCAAGSLTINDSTCSMENGTFALYPFTSGKMMITSQKAVTYAWFHIRPPVSLYRKLQEGKLLRHPIRPYDRKAAAAEICGLLTEYAILPEAAALCYHAVNLLLSLLVQSCQTEMDRAAKIPHYERLTGLRDEIYRFPENDWTIQDICDKLCLSRAYFHKIYQAAFGVTCTQDVIASRIARARFLLETTEDAIADISQQCGFETDVYFMRQFKRHAGMTPTVYRRLCRQRRG